MTRALLVVLVAVLAACGGDEPERVDLLLTADRLFDGRELVRNGAVAIRGAEIVAAGPRDEVDVDAARTRDLGDATILPGLVDLHTHGLGAGQVGSAVTTVRDVGANEAALPVERERPRAPRLLAAGPLVTVPGGYPIPLHGPDVAGVVRSPDDARALVARLAERGAAAIKVSIQYGPWPVLSRAELEAIVAESHERDLPVTAHVGDGEAARLALETGVDELAHMPCGFEPELMRELAEAEVEIVGTLFVVGEVSRCAGLVENARAFVEAGGTLLYGSDFGVPVIPPGVLVPELRLLRSAGLGPLDVLRNATSRSGEQLGLDGVGTLETGAPADVVVVRGDVAANLAALATPLLVLVRGDVVVDGPRLSLPSG